MKITEGQWHAIKGDTLNPDRTWGIVRYLTLEECQQVDGDEATYPSRTEVIAEVCSGPTEEGDARLMAASKDLAEHLDNVTAALETCLAWYDVKMPPGDRRQRRRLVKDARELLKRVRGENKF